MKDTEAREDIRELQTVVLERKSCYGLQEQVNDLWTRFLELEEGWKSRFIKRESYWEERKDEEK